MGNMLLMRREITTGFLKRVDFVPFMLSHSERKPDRGPPFSEMYVRRTLAGAPSSATWCILTAYLRQEIASWAAFDERRAILGRCWTVCRV